MRKLTPKRKKFVQLYTDENNKETFGNGTRSVMQSFNTTKPEVAKVMANEILTSPNVIKAIERKILKKEDIQNKLSSTQEKIDTFIAENDITPEIASILKENREYLLAHAKLNGDLIERVQSINVNIDRNRDLSTLTPEELQNEVMKRMMDTSVGGGGE